MMKQSRLAFMVVFLIILLGAGCQFEPTYTGSLTLIVPEALLTRSPSLNVSRGDVAADSVVRLYLMRNGTTQKIPGTESDVLEKTLPADRKVVIDDVFVGSKYFIYIAVGKGTGETFVPDYFGESDLFDVTSDGVTNVKITASASPFQVARGERASFAVLGGKLYALADNKLAEYADLKKGAEATLPAGYTGNSLSIGKPFDLPANRDADELWVNTNKRIVPYRNSSFKLDFGPEVAKGVTDSGAISIKSDKTGDAFRWAFYQLPGNLGTGYFPDKADESVTWTDVQTELNKSFGSNASGSEQIIEAIKKMTAMFLLDYWMGDSHAYVVPASALLISPLYVGKDVVDPFNEEKNRNNNSISFTWLKANVLDKGTISVGVSGTSITAVSKATDRLYVGTDKGIYWIAADAVTGKLGGNATMVSNTGKFDVRKISAMKTTAGEYLVAAVMKAADPIRNTLAVLKNDSIAKEYKFFSGVPKNMKQVLIYTEGTNVRIAASGDNAVVVVPAP